MDDCGKCGKLPEMLVGNGRLFLWPPTEHTTGKLLQLFKRADVATVRDGASDALVSKIDSASLPSLMVKLAGALTEEEMQDTKCLILEGEAEPTIRDFTRMQPLSRHLAEISNGWFLDILEHKRVRSLFQPIVTATEKPQMFAHECLLRGVDAQGEDVSPAQMFKVAEQAGLLFNLDRLARESAVNSAARARLGGKIFINFTPTSIYDPANCLKSTLRVIDESGLDRSRFVFEVIETERVDDIDHLAGVLAFYRRCGFEVALDDLGGGYSTLSMLPNLNPTYVKIDRSLISGIDRSETKQIISRRIIELCKDLGIRVIAEGIETAEEGAVARTLGADYLQGFFYGRPSDTGSAG